jgi:hypothetical protein
MRFSVHGTWFVTIADLLEALFVYVIINVVSTATARVREAENDW